MITAAGCFLFEVHNYFFGNSSQDEILKEMDNWPTYYPGKLSGLEIAQEMVSH